MKKVCSLLLVLAVLLSLCGCQCSHEWTEASCLTPRTCTKCEATEGEALGHVWADATCAAPKTCESCGLTEGETLAHVWTEASCAAPKTCESCGLTEGDALEHTWVEANYQAPQTCSVCAATEGSPLTPSFEELGLTLNEKDFDVPYTLVAGGQTVTVTLANHQVFESDAAHAAAEGYVWHSVEIIVEGEGSFGAYSPTYTDYNNYYDMEAFNGSLTVLDTDAVFALGHTVNFNGQDYTDVLFQVDKSHVDTLDSGWVFTEACAIRIPVGFDGIFVCVGNGDHMMGDYQAVYMNLYKDESTLFFRLK